VIGKAMVIKGHIRSKENMHVDGEVEGTLELSNSRLTVGPNGKVAANASAREVEVIGSITGDVEATHKITILIGGRLIGDLKTPGIVIEDGAYFTGKIEIGTSEAQVDTKTPEPAKKSAVGV
jgi:cytoskeletal protein CcmA (bactofilin family)